MLEVAITRAAHRPLSAVCLSPRLALDYQSNNLYDLFVDGRHWLVKEFLHVAEWEEAPRREFCALERLALLDLAPRPIFYDPALGPIVIYEFMPGVMWDRRHPSASELAQLADLWLKLNAQPTEGLWYSRNHTKNYDEFQAGLRASFQLYASWAWAEFPEAGRAAELCLELAAQRGKALRKLAERTPPVCFCRADPRFANVIARPDGRLGLVDWEDSGLRDPARDLADLLTHPNQEDLLSEQEWQAFLKPYLAARRRTDADIDERMQLYLGVFPLFWLSTLVRLGMKRASAGQLAGWTVNALPANQRLRRYLARALGEDAASESSSDVMFFPEG